MIEILVDPDCLLLSKEPVEKYDLVLSSLDGFNSEKLTRYCSKYFSSKFVYKFFENKSWIVPRLDFAIRALRPDRPLILKESGAKIACLADKLFDLKYQTSFFSIDKKTEQFFIYLKDDRCCPENILDLIVDDKKNSCFF